MLSFLEKLALQFDLFNKPQAQGPAIRKLLLPMAEGLLSQDRALERMDDILEVDSAFLLWNAYHKVGQKLQSHVPQKCLAFDLEILPQSSVRKVFLAWKRG